jgi:hypothetical protein
VEGESTFAADGMDLNEVPRDSRERMTEKAGNDAQAMIARLRRGLGVGAPGRPR